MSYKVAGIDVHKKVLMVVVAEVDASQPEWKLQRRRLGTLGRAQEALNAEYSEWSNAMLSDAFLVRCQLKMLRLRPLRE